MCSNPYKMTVGDVMSKEVVSVMPDDTVHDCIQRMVENRVYSLPVLGSQDECIGFISSSDLMEVTQELDEDLADLENADVITGRWLLERLMEGMGHTKVAEVMSEDVATVNVETRLPKAAREMLRNGVHRLPVIDIKDRVVGIISTTDILSAFVDGDPHDA
jgi:predicted transcriptional regulator